MREREREREREIGGGGGGGGGQGGRRVVGDNNVRAEVYVHMETC